MGQSRHWMLGACLGLLSGCASYRPKPLPPEQTAKDFESRSLSDPGLRRFLEKNLGQTLAPWPPREWSLDELVLAAFYFHPDLDVARAQWAVARGGEKTAAQRPNPTLTLGPGQYVSNPSPGLPSWILGLSLDIPIETAGKRGIRRRRAAAEAEAVRMNIAQTAWRVRSRLRSGLLAQYGSRLSEGILRDKQKELEDNARLLEGRSASGSASPFSAAQATLLAGKNRLALADAERQEMAAQIKLADEAGLPPAAVEGLKFSSSTFSELPGPEDPAFARARQAALLGRADLLGALASYAASEAALQLEVANQYPDIHLGPGFSYDQGQDKWGLQLALPMPLFHRNQGPIAEAEARRQEAAARFLALQDKVINEIDLALADYRLACRKLKAADQILAAHLSQDARLRQILRPGDVSRLILFRAQLDIADTKLARSDAWLKAQQALGALEDAWERPFGSAPLAASSLQEDPRRSRQ